MKRSLLPALPTTDGGHQLARRRPLQIRELVPKRKKLVVACEQCRKKKTKCDGLRPKCGRCVRIAVDCHYDADEDVVSRTSALKRAVSKTNHENQQLSHSVAAWEELVRNLQLRSEEEAFELLRRLRMVQDPLTVLDFVRDGDLLLSCGVGGITQTKQESKINANALDLAPIRVPARPWTAIAQDGIVSELVSGWFKWDDTFGYPFIHREAFLADMRRGNADQARYCSRFLVNALCAFRCFTSESVLHMSFALKTNLRTTFFNEARKQFDLDPTASITNVQGLWILFMFSCAAGTDRAGSMYRFAAYEMLKRMRLQATYSNLRDTIPEEATQKTVIAKLYWGVFCFESLASQAFFQPSAMKTPWMPCPYPVSQAGVTKDDNLDMFGHPYTNSAPGPPMISGARWSTSQLCVLMNEVMEYVTGVTRGVGQGPDLQRRSQFMTLLFDFGRSLPPSLQLDENFTHQTCFLWILYNTVGYNILRNLDADVIVAGSTVKEHVLRYCELDTSIMERARAAQYFVEWSVVVVCGVLNALPSLVPLLKDSQAQIIFTRSFTIALGLGHQLPILRILLRGVQAMVSTLGQKFPPALQPAIHGLTADTDLTKDVPTMYQLPHTELMRKMLLDDNADMTSVGVDLSFIIAKWSALSIA